MKNVMKNAWEIARNAVVKFGGNVKEYFAASLKLAWANAKCAVKTVYAIKDWFVDKNFSNEQAYAINCECDRIEVTKETEKAYNVTFHTAYGKIFSWVPKSVCMTKEQVKEEAEKAEKAWENGFEKNQRLLAEAKELGVKGLRPRNRTETLIKKINARKNELGIA